jgi:hypothetical protein
LEDAILPLMLNNCKMSTELNQYLSNCQLLQVDFYFYFFFPGQYDGKFVGLAYQGKDIVFRFIKEYSSLMGFGP